MPNSTQACTCAGGSAGTRTCEAGGAAFSPCDCGVSDGGGTETGGEGGSIDSSAPPVDAGTGQVAVLGTSCGAAGALACAGNYQKVTLLCGTGGTWQVNKTCGSDEFCDSTPGPNAGVCRPVLPECKTLKPGDTFCVPPVSLYAPAYLRQCGPDAVTSTLVKDCRAGSSTNHPPGCVDGACTICTPGDYRCDGNQPQDCNWVGATYTWRNMGSSCTNGTTCSLSQIDGMPHCIH